MVMFMHLLLCCRRSGRLPRFLVLAPTRELAKQVEKEIKESAPYLSTVCVYGGVSYVTQQGALSRGVDVVVGTPGRIIDLINGNSLKLSEVQYLVLDEADQMLAVGFEEDVEMILENLPAQRQSMLFSATMPSWVKKLARKYLNNPLTIDLVNFCYFWLLYSNHIECALLADSTAYDCVSNIISTKNAFMKSIAYASVFGQYICICGLCCSMQAGLKLIIKDII